MSSSCGPGRGWRRSGQAECYYREEEDYDAAQKQQECNEEKEQKRYSFWIVLKQQTKRAYINAREEHGKGKDVH